MDKKSWLDYLFYNLGQQNYNFFICGLRKDEQGNTKSTKWKRYSEAIFLIDFDGSCDDWKTQKFFEEVNQRQIFPNEILLDLEEPDRLNEVTKKLDSWNVKFNVYTAGKGFHIDIWFPKSLSEKQKIKIIKFFKCDMQKASAKTMIALEYTPHWKNQKLKQEVEWKTI
jgi:hypothetical protein